MFFFNNYFKSICILSFIFILNLSIYASSERKKAVLLDINGPIGPAISDYLHRGFKKAEQLNSSVIIIRMDTPGGLDSSMRKIIKDILSSKIPIITYIYPKGSHAASAGTYILYASHVAVMTYATNLGAATPVNLGGLPMLVPDYKKDSKKTYPTIVDKVVSDAVAYIRGLAQLRGRNVDIAEKIVTQAESFSAEEALRLGIIDLIADDFNELFEKINGSTVKVLNQNIHLETKDIDIILVEPDWRTKFLSVITKPDIAYILLLIGFYGLLFEFIYPGTIAAGVIGGICLIFALFALHVLPVNYAGLILVLLGLAFMVSEAFLPSFGILGIGGGISFVIGSIILLNVDIPGYGISWSVIISVVGISCCLFIATLIMVARSRSNNIISGHSTMINNYGKVIKWKKFNGQIKVNGEIWQAISSRVLKAGTIVHVIDIKGLTLIVESADLKK